MIPRIAVIGSSNTDLVVRCPRLPRAGETVLGGDFSRFCGGKGANQAVAAARAGAHVIFIGAHGNDEFGHAARTGLRREGVNVRFFRKRDGLASGVALILVGGRSRQNLIAVAASANDSLGPQDVAAAESVLGKCAAIVSQLEVPLPAVAAAAEIAARYGIPFMLNPAPARKLPRKLLGNVQILTPNLREAQLLSGARSARDAARWLRAAGCASVVVTCGAQGVWLADAAGERRLPAPKVVPVDTVGAGDCFTAWLAVGVAEGLSLVDAAERAMQAAALSVTRMGAQAGLPRRAEVAG